MKSHRIAIAEDDPDALYLLERMLADLYPGSSISTFTNAEDALSHVRERGADVLITNHGMGAMNGTDLIRLLRADHCDMHMIMISGNPGARTEAEAAGATAFIEKTSNTESLKKRLTMLIPP
jgi:DNA-binding NtrC family response regulator